MSTPKHALRDLLGRANEFREMNYRYFTEQLGLAQSLVDSFKWSRSDMAIFGDSKCSRETKERIALAAHGDVTVVLVGPTGTGKDPLARLMHLAKTKRETRRAWCHFWESNPDMLRSQLIGHASGALPGARVGTVGAVVQAHGGTLFLDDFQELKPPCVNLLREVLERTGKRLRRFGASLELMEEILRGAILPDLFPDSVRALEEQTLTSEGKETVDILKELRKEQRFRFKVIVGTQTPLEELLGRDVIPKDLYYRLKTCVIRIPTLSERPAEVEPLLGMALQDFSVRSQEGSERTPMTVLLARAKSGEQVEVMGIDPALVKRILKHKWDGELRELRTIAQLLVETGVGKDRIMRANTFVDDLLGSELLGQSISAPDLLTWPRARHSEGERRRILKAACRTANDLCGVKGGTVNFRELSRRLLLLNYKVGHATVNRWFKDGTILQDQDGHYELP